MNSPSGMFSNLALAEEELTPYEVIKNDSIFLKKFVQGSRPISEPGSPFKNQETAAQSLKASTQQSIAFG